MTGIASWEPLLRASIAPLALVVAASPARAQLNTQHVKGTFGMWGQEVMAGVTGYLTEDRKYHAASAVSFNFQSKKEDSETKVGNAMNLEGGIAGKAFESARAREIQGLPPIFVRGKNRVFAIGPEVTLTLARKNTVYGFLNVKYFWETTRVRTRRAGLFS